MNTKAIFLFSAVLFVALNLCCGATTETKEQTREKRQYGGYGGYGGGFGGGQPQIANSQATAVNNGPGGLANANSNSQNNGGYGGFGLGGYGK